MLGSRFILLGRCSPSRSTLGSRSRAGLLLVGKDGGADDIRKGLLSREAAAAPLTPLQCPLYLCPPLEALEEGGPPLTLGLEGEHQRSNAALALQLARCWLQRKDHPGKRAGTRGACP